MEISNELCLALKNSGFSLKTGNLSSVAKKPRRSPNFRSGEEFLVNRMPLMCAFAYVVAKKSGFSENLSKSLGYAVGTYYAIMKNVGLRNYGGIPSKSHLKSEGTLDDELIESGKDISKLDYLDFCGGTFILEGEKVLGIATIRGKQTSYDTWHFDNQVSKIEAIKKGAFEKVCQKWEEILAEDDLEEIKSGRMYFRVWKEWRDELRKREFYF
jgi:hypothetical protein